MSELRRSEFAVTDATTIRELLDSVRFGSLAYLRVDGTPGVSVLNFVRIEDLIYFHGSPHGERAASLRVNPSVAFLAADPLALIPSHFLHPELACPATQFFRSVVIRGEVRIVRDRAEKAIALAAFMQKLQPEGGYAPVRDDDLYRKSLEATEVFALPVGAATAKFKLGQNLPAHKRREVADRIAERGSSVDLATVKAMRELGLLGD
ncbi:MAG: hypothetical protein KatS3mg063_1454 [Tepidiforma sp.]|jgi:hypothetical protein|uniref:pyridoxamine 5'-phosphate oxidase family protein n=1 Tax=Tepidiforma sp. TaxID=2682230 RepID=UPI0021DD1135|nr:pyridoxamine 5'-phosphate oxidase family protein [Tepidiforma sp.]GIW15601.1 MAG: hypothetical protein KatS3mg063_1454 [Tepidiforma sp.]